MSPASCSKHPVHLWIAGMPNPPGFNSGIGFTAINQQRSEILQNWKTTGDDNYKYFNPITLLKKEPSNFLHGKTAPLIVAWILMDITRTWEKWYCF
uniref:Respiratory dimethylsulfoxide reductase n=1 Tax=Rhabditophanes sp. KR3021 TaxID=114890 RepID=A0AC35TUN5_9BILA